MFSCFFFHKDKKPKTAAATNLLKINKNEIVTDKRLGKGGSGDVFHGQWNEKSIAIKHFPVPDYDVYSDEEENNAYNKECRKYAYECERDMAQLLINKKNLNEYVIQYYGCIEAGESYSLVMEFMPKGDLFGYIFGDYPPNLTHTMFLACDVVTGLQWLHQYKIIHCDIKLENILISEKLTAKIADFGSSISIENTAPVKMLKGTCGYQAPELLRAEIENRSMPYSSKSDLYAFGIMLVEMINLESAYDEMPRKKVDKLTLSNKRPNISDECPQDLKAVIQSIWLENPIARPETKVVRKELEMIRNTMRP